MPLAHRHGDSRVCGGKTDVIGQSTVTINGKLWAVKGDLVDHGGGPLTNSIQSVTINGLPIIVHAPDLAAGDDLCPIPGGPHCAPNTASACESVTVG